jgi:hypothetical protein
MATGHIPVRCITKSSTVSQIHRFGCFERVCGVVYGTLSTFRGYTLQFGGTETRWIDLKGPKHGWTHPSTSTIVSYSVPTPPLSSAAPPGPKCMGRTHAYEKLSTMRRPYPRRKDAKLKAHRNSARAEGYRPVGCHQPRLHIIRYIPGS